MPLATPAAANASPDDATPVGRGPISVEREGATPAAAAAPGQTPGIASTTSGAPLPTRQPSSAEPRPAGSTADAPAQAVSRRADFDAPAAPGSATPTEPLRDEPSNLSSGGVRNPPDRQAPTAATPEPGSGYEPISLELPSGGTRDIPQVGRMPAGARDDDSQPRPDAQTATTDAGPARPAGEPPSAGSEPQPSFTSLQRTPAAAPTSPTQPAAPLGEQASRDETAGRSRTAIAPSEPSGRAGSTPANLEPSAPAPGPTDTPLEFRRQPGAETTDAPGQEPLQRTAEPAPQSPQSNSPESVQPTAPGHATPDTAPAQRAPDVSAPSAGSISRASEATATTPFGIDPRSEPTTADTGGAAASLQRRSEAAGAFDAPAVFAPNEPPTEPIAAAALLPQSEVPANAVELEFRSPGSDAEAVPGPQSNIETGEVTASLPDATPAPTTAAGVPGAVARSEDEQVAPSAAAGSRGTKAFAVGLDC